MRKGNNVQELGCKHNPGSCLGSARCLTGYQKSPYSYSSHSFELYRKFSVSSVSQLKCEINAEKNNNVVDTR